MKKWLERHAPLGIEVTTEAGLYILGAVIATMHSLLFFLNYGNARNELYEYRASGKVLKEGAIIQSFDVLTEELFLTFYLVMIVTFFVVIGHYFYHYQGSKMMYLMKRLPDKGEVHRRCWTLPVTGTVLLVVWMMLLKMIYYAIYILCTPSQCLPL